MILETRRTAMWIVEKKNTLIRHSIGCLIREEVTHFHICLPSQWGFVVLLFYIHGKHLWSCWDGQLTNHTFPGQA